MARTWFDLSLTCYVMLCYIMVVQFYYCFAFISFQSTRKSYASYTSIVDRSTVLCYSAAQ